MTSRPFAALRRDPRTPWILGALALCLGGTEIEAIAARGAEHRPIAKPSTMQTEVPKAALKLQHNPFTPLYVVAAPAATAQATTVGNQQQGQQQRGGLIVPDVSRGATTGPTSSIALCQVSDRPKLAQFLINNEERFAGVGDSLGALAITEIRDEAVYFADGSMIHQTACPAAGAGTTSQGPTGIERPTPPPSAPGIESNSAANRTQSKDETPTTFPLPRRDPGAFGSVYGEAPPTSPPLQQFPQQRLP